MFDVHKIEISAANKLIDNDVDHLALRIWPWIIYTEQQQQQKYEKNCQAADSCRYPSLQFVFVCGIKVRCKLYGGSTS